MFFVIQKLSDGGYVKLGHELPKEIIAVVRPRLLEINDSIHETNLVDKSLAMHLEVKVLDFVPNKTSNLNIGEETRVVYNEIAKATTRQQIQGLYCFATKGTQLEHLFTQLGTYTFHFSLVSVS